MPVIKGEMMSAQEDEKMLVELLQMAHIYAQYGRFDLAEKMRDLALQVKSRIQRSQTNIVSMSEWSEKNQGDSKSA